MATDQATWEQWFTAVWEQREEHVYRDLFGTIGDRPHTLSEKQFQQFHDGPVDPRWLTHSVLECPPHGTRRDWAYVTSGMSNPWGQDPAAVDAEQYSGLGFEFLMLTPGPAPWAISTLQWLMVIQILTATGLVSGALVECNDRVPLFVPIVPGTNTALRNILLTEPEEFPQHFSLPSGRVDLFLCVGISDAEMAFADAQGSPGLLVALKHHGYFPRTDPSRPSAM